MEQVADARVRLRVGETVFHTTTGTLSESRLLMTLISMPPPADGEYFVDGDPDLFAHILRYLRTKMYPIFFDKINGHDVCLYAALLQQARFYQIERLEEWIAEKKYYKAVRKQQRHFEKTLYGRRQIQNMHEYLDRGEELVVASHKKFGKKVPKCPLGIWEHDGSTAACLSNRCFRIAGKSSAVDWPPDQCLEIEGFAISVLGRHDLLFAEEPPEDPAHPPAGHVSLMPPPYDHGDSSSMGGSSAEEGAAATQNAGS